MLNMIRYKILQYSKDDERFMVAGTTSQTTAYRKEHNLTEYHRMNRNSMDHCMEYFENHKFLYDELFRFTGEREKINYIIL